METLKKSVVVGVAGTLAMTLYSFLAGVVHLPTADMHSFVATLFRVDSMMGWLFYLTFGVVCAYAYKAHFRARMPASSWMRGLYYAFFLWMLMHVVIMPVMGMGFFAGSFVASLGMFVGFMCYGAVVGFLYEQ